ncbi:MAG TPA: hypothetical protein VK605_07165 [Solirubrobacteraceae bacterium]|nr:hypothetical protein [Solirubrobacteraceae bacterium]
MFDLERRIYRVDRLRLNPAGVPVRGIVYLLALLAATLVVARLPLAGLAVRELPWFVGYLAIPGLTAALLTVVRIEGRPFHLAARSLVRYRVHRRRGAGTPVSRGGAADGAPWTPPPILMLPDGADGTPRLRYTGPGALLVSAAHERRSANGLRVRLGLRPHVSVRRRPDAARPAGGTVILLDRAARLSVR